MSAKHRPTFLILLALLFALTLPGCTFGQQTAEDFVDRGKVKYARSDWDGAIADYSKAIELNPKFAGAYLNRGNARRGKGDQAGADADLAQAAKLQNASPPHSPTPP